MDTDIPDSVGYMKVTARGITALADSDDPGDRPDAESMIGSVRFKPSIGSKPIVAIGETPKLFIALDTIKAGMDSNGRLRPPADGKTPPLDSNGNLFLVAPDQPAGLSVFGWTWEAEFEPAAGQGWSGFTVRFRGEPDTEVDLVEAHLIAEAMASGGFSPMIHSIPGPWDPETDSVPVGVNPGEYVLDESTGDIWLIEPESDPMFLVNLGGGGPVPWANIQNKPSEYPPAAHTHTLEDITDYEPPHLAAVATSGSYTDLTNRPTIPDGMPNTIAIVGSGAATATGIRSLAIGHQADASDNQRAIAIGPSTWVRGDRSIAIGDQARTEKEAIALGAPSPNYVEAGDYSVAIGAGSSANYFSVALGYQAKAAHTNSVALGKGTETTHSNQVAVGGRDIEVQDPSYGVVLRSGDGTRWRIKVNNNGELSTVQA